MACRNWDQSPLSFLPRCSAVAIVTGRHSDGPGRSAGLAKGLAKGRERRGGSCRCLVSLPGTGERPGLSKLLLIRLRCISHKGGGVGLIGRISRRGMPTSNVALITRHRNESPSDAQVHQQSMVGHKWRWCPRLTSAGASPPPSAPSIYVSLIP